MERLEDQRQFYLEVWQDALGKLLGWSKEEVLEWAGGWIGWVNMHPIFFHESPINYVLGRLIPRGLYEALSQSEIYDVEAEIERLCNWGQKPFFPGDRDYDWELARRQINEVLARYGCRLPEPRPSAGRDQEPPAPWSGQKEFYLKVWQEAFGKLAGWTEHEVRQWANCHVGWVYDRQSFFEEPPIYHAIWAIIPEAVLLSVSFIEYPELYAELERVCYERQGSLTPGDPNYDWDALRAQINKILSRYGQQLPASG